MPPSLLGGYSLTKTHPTEKVLLFSQFADTVYYLESELIKAHIPLLAGVTGASEDPTAFAWRFSPLSNKKTLKAGEELRVLLATDVLSEGQNLQDCAVVINYDLPWALVRLIQRVGRVDRIGQKADTIHCYSFLPAEGLETIIRLRRRVKTRLAENGEVIGSDERFFEDDLSQQSLHDLYTEKSGILDKETDNEVDLASQAYQIWHNAVLKDPGLEKKIESLPDVVYSTREHAGSVQQPQGVLLYMKTAESNDSLVWINRKGESVTQSQMEILKAARCEPAEPAIPRHDQHHELVRRGITEIIKNEKVMGGQLGRVSGARYRTYKQLKSYYDELVKHEPLFANNELSKVIDDVFKFPLRPLSVDLINRQLRNGIADEKLADLVINLRTEDRLSIRQAETERQEPRIICSLGLFPKE
jgi:superfamily II DNA/RNA helicase